MSVIFLIIIIILIVAIVVLAGGADLDCGYIYDEQMQLHIWSCGLLFQLIVLRI